MPSLGTSLRQRAFKKAKKATGECRSDQASRAPTMADIGAASDTPSPIPLHRRVFRKVTISKRKRQVAGTVGFVALAALSKTADDLNIPGIKAAVGVAQEIAKLVQNAKRNKEQCFAVLDLVNAVVQVLVKETQGKNPGELGDGFEAAIEQFRSELECVREDIAKISSRGLLRRMAATEDDKDVIQKCKNKLDTAKAWFSVSNQVAIRVAVVETRQGQIAVEPVITVVSAQLEASAFFFNSCCVEGVLS
ncbi:hypothetical protein GLOTRDRAFT_141272 [Gloeophyllum trabeum ATCC 11539]|uniref:Mixed lineage kinase domain-containing protein n=1 Tax=Gloeophyllum trabeum (strain ATCC 11539 / FP-39264 / Madison 617) TaxID=670483 RepID=S7PTU2_GLOTA|nr:uncharacterized protein GLOTRDRAFT_141272 [Gloeophyllum trabeum ATCC 11539]EPQ50752.1 hypothetical protein GLOTRDRAFT_141272 [Gloeophyllum trabeum ATCC 11539]